VCICHAFICVSSFTFGLCDCTVQWAPAVVDISREHEELNLIFIPIFIELKLLFQPVCFIACCTNFQISNRSCRRRDREWFTRTPCRNTSCTSSQLRVLSKRRIITAQNTKCGHSSELHSCESRNPGRQTAPQQPFRSENSLASAHRIFSMSCKDH
jgi:hypothetical protein